MRALPLISAVAALAAAGPVVAQSAGSADASDHAIYGPADVQWQPGPSSLPEGAQYAVLEGNPANEGYFALRIKLPDGYVIPPHWHPVKERVTVLSGAFHLGMGEVVERQRAQRLLSGSYFSLPPRMAHFAVAEGETVIQLTSVGPWQINYIDPSDDPRQ
jgi:quercetin dioxygenase-like cupin family protein